MKRRSLYFWLLVTTGAVLLVGLFVPCYRQCLAVTHLRNAGAVLDDGDRISWINKDGAKWFGSNWTVNLSNAKISPRTLDKLADLFGVESLTVEGQTAFTDEQAQVLSKLPRLKSLHLINVTVGDAGLSHLRCDRSLESLDLTGTLITGATLEKLRTFPQLNDLNPDATRIVDEDLRHLSQVSSLTGLSLQGTDIADAGLMHLREMELRRLSLGDTKITDRGMAHLKVARLTVVDLSSTAITNESLRLLKDSPLRELQVGITQIDDDGLKYLAGKKLLFELGLRKTQVTDAGMQHLLGITPLMQVSLAWTRVGDAGATQLLREIRGLKTLELSGTQVTNALASAISEWHFGETIYLSQTRFTQEGFKQVKDFRGQIIYDTP